MANLLPGERVTFAGAQAVPLGDAVPLPEPRRAWSGMVVDDTGGRTILVAVSVRGPQGEFRLMKYVVPRRAITGPVRHRRHLRDVDFNEVDERR
jgi:hypothetical protein